MADGETKKRDRKANFSDDEIACLLEGLGSIASEKNFIQSRLRCDQIETRGVGTDAAECQCLPKRNSEK